MSQPVFPEDNTIEMKNLIGIITSAKDNKVSMRIDPSWVKNFSGLIVEYILDWNPDTKEMIMETLKESGFEDDDLVSFARSLIDTAVDVELKKSKRWEEKRLST